MAKTHLLGALLFAPFIAHPNPCPSATIVWGNIHPEGPALATDSQNNPLCGTNEFGPTPTLSLGALVQLWKAVGAPDDPLFAMGAYQDTNWRINDILLDETHIGYGTFADPKGAWCQVGHYEVEEGDVLYVRVYNVSKPDFAGTSYLQREVGIRSRPRYTVPTAVVGDVKNPQIFYFDNLTTGVPEAASLCFLIPGMALWALRRKKHHHRFARRPAQPG